MQARWGFWVVGTASLGLAAGWVLRGQLQTPERIFAQAAAPQRSRTQSPTSPTRVPATSPVQKPVPPAVQKPQVTETGEVIAYTFGDEVQMREFANLWQQRREMLLRMDVLRSYWDESQERLSVLSGELTTTYGIDPAKNYLLKDKERALIEQEPPVVPAPAQPGVPSSASKSAPEATTSSEGKENEGKVFRTFTTEEEMQAFTTLWRQHQEMALRMLVVRQYWNQEQAKLAPLNSDLASRFNLDVAKNYIMDTQRRILIEQKPPPAATSPVIPQPESSQATEVSPQPSAPTKLPQGQ